MSWTISLLTFCLKFPHSFTSLFFFQWKDTVTLIVCEKTLHKNHTHSLSLDQCYLISLVWFKGHFGLLKDGYISFFVFLPLGPSLSLSSEILINVWKTLLIMDMAMEYDHHYMGGGTCWIANKQDKTSTEERISTCSNKEKFHVSTLFNVRRYALSLCLSLKSKSIVHIPIITQSPISQK